MASAKSSCPAAKTTTKAPPPSSADSSETNTTSFCQRNKSAGSGSFMSELRHRFHEFTHAPVNEHRTCIVTYFHKAYKRVKNFGERSSSGSTTTSSGSSPADAENPQPVAT